jgi:glycosyltransferase involved in cell wall biosynthesis
MIEISDSCPKFLMMNEIILDCDLMRFPNSGLYYYCQNLGNQLGTILSHHRDERIRMYVPRKAGRPFNRAVHQVTERPWHRFWQPFMRNCRVWHAPFQSGRIFPDRQKYQNVKILLTIHDLNFLHEERTPEEIKNSIAHTQSLIDRSDALVCISEFTKGDVLRHCDTGGKPLYVIHNGRNALQAAGLATHSYQPARPFLFGMGYVNRKKNYKVLVSLLRQNKDIELLIAGRLDEPDYIRSMQESAAECGVSDRLKILGPVSENEKAWYLSNCQAFMHPSLAEGFGFPVIEAMTFGKPVFLSNTTSLPEIGGDVAFYFSSFEPDHMQNVFINGMQQYGANGLSKRIKMRGEQFSWERSAEKYLEVYRSLY